MESYDEFEQDLNRMPSDRRSSQNTTRPRFPRTPDAPLRSQTSNQGYDESLHTAPQDDIGIERSDGVSGGLQCVPSSEIMRKLEERTETRPASRNEQTTTRRARETPLESFDEQPLHLNNSERPAQQSGISQPDRAMGELEASPHAGRDEQTMIEFSFHPQATTDSYNASGRPSNFPEFNVSGRPFNISEFATRPVAPQLQASDTYNASGRPLNLSEFARTQPGSQERQPEHHDGRTVELSEFPGDSSLVQRQAYDSFTAYSWPLTAHFDQSRWRSLGRCHGQQQRRDLEPNRAQTDRVSDYLFNSSKLPSLRRGSDQAHPHSLNPPNRRANQSHFAGNRSPSVQPPDVGQIPAFTSTVGRTRARQNQEYNFSLKIPLKNLDFCGESASMTRNTQGTWSKGPGFADRSGREFHRDMAERAFDCGLESRPQASRVSSGIPWRSGHGDVDNLSGESRGSPDQFQIPHDDTSPRLTSCHRGSPKFPSFLECGGPPTRHPLFNTLVRDTYYPGAIDDAVNANVDFNAIAFDSAFGVRPIPDELDAEDVPMSLLQAFEERLNYEDDLRASLKRRRREFSLDGVTTPLQPPSIKEDPDEATQDHATFWSHRDELKLASTVDIDLATSYRDQPQTGLTTALACLAKAEKMNNFDKSVHLAEEAIRKRTADTPSEKAALKSSCSFHINMRKDETKTEKTTYNPIEIISYVGTTKPREE